MKTMVTGGTEYLMLGILDIDDNSVSSVFIIGGESKEKTIQRSDIKHDRFGQAYFIRNGYKYHMCQFA